MKSLKASPIANEALQELRRRLSSDTSPSDLVAGMREMGLDKIDSMKFLREYGGMSLPQAKDAVHTSSAWDDRRATDDNAHVMAENVSNAEFNQKQSAA